MQFSSLNFSQEDWKSIHCVSRNHRWQNGKKFSLPRVWYWVNFWVPKNAWWMDIFQPLNSLGMKEEFCLGYKAVISFLKGKLGLHFHSTRFIFMSQLKDNLKGTADEEGSLWHQTNNTCLKSTPTICLQTNIRASQWNVTQRNVHGARNYPRWMNSKLFTSLSRGKSKFIKGRCLHGGPIFWLTIFRWPISGGSGGCKSLGSGLFDPPISIPKDHYILCIDSSKVLSMRELNCLWMLESCPPLMGCNVWNNGTHWRDIIFKINRFDIFSEKQGQ